LYGIKSPVTRGYYLRRLSIFNYIKLLRDETIEKRCDFLAIHARKDPNWAFNYSFDSTRLAPKMFEMKIY
jgi:hypothetical protein